MDPMKLTVSDYRAFGELVKKWVHDKTSWPKDLDDLKTQAQRARAGMNIPGNYKRLEVIPLDTETFYLMVPAKELVEQTEEKIAQGDNYPLPRFYEEVLMADLPSMTTEEAMDLHARRIADYTTAQCG